MLKAAVEHFLNDSAAAAAKSVNNFTNENIKHFLSPYTNNSIIVSDQHNYNNTIGYNQLEPRFPDYIIVTSMVFCITIMILGLVGNIMVRYHNFCTNKIYLTIKTTPLLKSTCYWWWRLRSSSKMPIFLFSSLILWNCCCQQSEWNNISHNFYFSPYLTLTLTLILVVVMKVSSVQSKYILFSRYITTTTTTRWQ